MNAYYNKNEEFNSNKRIIEAYFGESAKTTFAGQKVIDALLACLSALVCALCSATARRVIKATVFSVTLVGFVGVIGAMEHGSIGLGAGLALGIVLLCVELLCLRPHRS